MPPSSSSPSGSGSRPNGDASELEIGPFLKWPGGKRWLVELHAHLFRFQFDRYIEPFLGAGSVYFHLKPEQAILGDLNEDLITAYRGIQQDPDGVQILLEKHHVLHNKEYYYEVRKEIPPGLVARAARIIYLNRTCFNGIYRVNQQGLFNVPIGTRDQVVRDTDNFAGVSRLLHGVDLRHGDFEPLVDEAQAGDFVFLDPPYTVRHNTNGFIKYNEKLFSWDDQERLAKAATRAAERGAKVVVTNASHITVRRLYPGSVFKFRRVSRFSSISASGDSRKHFEELVITNKHTGRARAVRGFLQ
ncbi:Dam family site-specific DNA-(adenine-N6)-methyltransferase [Nocardia vinacea]|uniref:DNA adenine methylase n=1 Tax=Nocardia vinacea TaxID=96468 RepID=UPI002E0F0EF7|nr:Dam family site-specific DNA-(adenine-N6)-methyltransferase [Nocardia vinacea]